MKKVLVSIILLFLIFGGIIIPNVSARENQDVTTSALGFKDLGTGNTFYNDIKYLTSQGIISGFPDGTFRVNDKVTRAQALIMIGRANGWGETWNTKFKDVPSTVRGSGYIHTAAGRGVLDLLTYNDGSFKPQQPLNRSEMAILLHKTYNFPETNQNNIYSDVNESGGDYESIMSVTAREMAKGYEDGTYRPFDHVTRGQFAAFLTRTFRVVIGSGSLNVTIDPTENAILAKGISFGASKQEVINKIGNPNVRDNKNEDYFLYMVENTYDKTDSALYIEFYNDKVSGITFGINNNVVNADWYKNLGEPFATSGGITYFYLEGAEQILMFKPNESTAYVVYADNNFYELFGMEEKM